MITAQFGIPGYARYLLHVGSMRPRENLERLVDAFAIVRERRPEIKLHLVLAGDIALGGHGEQKKHNQRVRGSSP